MCFFDHLDAAGTGSLDAGTVQNRGFPGQFPTYLRIAMQRPRIITNSYKKVLQPASSDCGKSANSLAIIMAPTVDFLLVLLAIFSLGKFELATSVYY